MFFSVKACQTFTIEKKPVSQISFNLFWSGHKRLLSEFLTKSSWFHGHDERFLKYLGEKLKF